MDIPRMGLPDHLAARLSMAEQHDLLTGRRGIRRRTLFAAAAGAALAAGVPAFAAPRRAERLHGGLVVPFGRHLAWGANPRRQVRVGWQVPHQVNRPFLRLGDSPSNLGQRIEAEVRPLHSEVENAIAPFDQYYLHAVVDDLLPGHTYYYSVGHHGMDPAGKRTFDRVDSFTTAPSRRRVAGPFTFTAFGDQGVGSHALSNDGQVAAQKPAFHLHAGDLCYADSSGQGQLTDLYDPHTWDQFLTQTEPVAATVPWMPALGNHDMEALYSADGYGGQLARWDFPTNGPAKSTAVYSFIYGNVGVIALDANDISFETAVNRGYTGGTQTKWLDERLKFLRGEPDVDFIVVFFHHCAYSTAPNHASDGAVRSIWVPLFDKYHVDLIVNGHNHIYERADAMRHGRAKRIDIGDTVDPQADGTIYVTAGAAGGGLYDFAAPDSYARHEKHLDEVESFVWADGRERVAEKVTWSRVRYTGYSFLAVDVDPAAEGNTTTMTLRAVTEHGHEVDRVVIARKAGGATRHKLDDNIA
jgi:hypothetical protein